MSSPTSSKTHALKKQFYQLLGSLDPVAALHYLHYEGIVNKDVISSGQDSQEVTKPAPRIQTWSYFPEADRDPLRCKDTTEAKKKLEELAKEKGSHVDLQSLVNGLKEFSEVHSRDSRHHEAEG